MCNLKTSKRSPSPRTNTIFNQIVVEKLLRAEVNRPSSFSLDLGLLNIIMGKMYLSAKLVRYHLSGGVKDDFEMSVLERLQKADAEFEEELEADAFLKETLRKWMRGSLTSRQLSSPAVRLSLRCMVRAAKLRAQFTIIQEERLRKNLNWIRESDRKKAVNRIRCETTLVNRMIGKLQRHSDDEGLTELKEQLEVFVRNRVSRSGAVPIADMED